MNRAARVKLVVAGALGLLAVLISWGWLGEGRMADRAFYYDLSERELFVGPLGAVPPIRGINDEQEDAVRAVVISTNGNPADRSARTIAYLERYSPELKRQMEQAQAEGGSPAMGRGMAQAHRFVKRVDDDRWYPMLSEEAEKIVAEWLTAGPDGGRAVICTP